MGNATASTTAHADKIVMQHKLFAELSAMFGKEVPLYDKSLLVNKVSNETVCTLLSARHQSFDITEDQLEKASGERHGAIRIGTYEEYRWIAGYFSAFGMEPHNFYDMTSLGGKSQPIIATAFRSPLNPEHRVFTSLLMIENLPAEIRPRVQDLLSRRQVFTDRARELVLKNENEGGLSQAEAEELVQEGTNRIFKWTAQANDYDLYNQLCEAGFKIAADISCFQSHHLNHLTPNTLCMDLYTSAMKFALGELSRDEFVRRATQALMWLRKHADHDYMKLHFRHLSVDDIKQFTAGEISDGQLETWANALADRLGQPDLDLTELNHSGFKDFTEGPDMNTPVLLRQDSYKALTEAVTFHQPDGTQVQAKHTARFGEIEQRFYATTPKGRELYDRCLAEANAARDKNPALVKNDYDAYLHEYGAAFAEFPETLPELLQQGLVFGRYSATDAGRKQAAAGISSTDIQQLISDGYVDYEGLRYEDFLPFSAAGIFASNLGQYGTKTETAREAYTTATLEEIMGRTIIDPNVVYRALEAQSLLKTYADLGLTEKIDRQRVSELEAATAVAQNIIA